MPLRAEHPRRKKHPPLSAAKAASESGFALAELLIALAIVALLSLVTASITQGSINLFVRGQQQISSTSALSRTQITLADMLTNAHPPGAQNRAIFKATPTAVSWTGGQSPFALTPGLYQYELALAPATDKDGSLLSQVNGDPSAALYDLWLSWRPLIALPLDISEGTSRQAASNSAQTRGQHRLAHKLPALEFSFPTRSGQRLIPPFSTQAAADDTVRKIDKLPTSIRIAVPSTRSSMPSDARFWPEFFVAFQFH